MIGFAQQCFLVDIESAARGFDAGGEEVTGCDRSRACRNQTRRVLRSSCPMRPMPRMPSVAWWMSGSRRITGRSGPFSATRRAERNAPDSAMRRAAAIINAKPKSAVVALSTPGVFVIQHTLASTRVYVDVVVADSDVAHRTQRWGRHPAQGCVDRSLPWVIAPDLPCRRSISSGWLQTVSSALSLTSKYSAASLPTMSLERTRA